MIYCPQSSGKVKSMNRTLKLQSGKLCQETHLQWDQLLPIASLRIRSSPTKQTGLSPFEVLYGHPTPLIKGIQGDLKEIGDFTMRQQRQALGLTLKDQYLGPEETSVSLTTLKHTYRQGDAIWVKEWISNH
jgi:hypothetical protein